MVLCVKVPLKNAQEIKEYILENYLFNQDYRFKHTKTHIFFPITNATGIKKRFKFAEFEDVKSLPKVRKNIDVKTEINKKLTKGEADFLRRAYDVTGTIAILEISEALKKKEKFIAETFLKGHKNITTVLKKADIHGTKFRTQKMKYLAGARTKETVHIEHGVRIKLDVEKVYFSPRLSNERKRIAEQVKPGETILVMFSGCAPYPCVLSRHTEAKEIIGIELNPVGHDYGVENVKLNKQKNITLINADAKDAKAITQTKFDRILMPLPKTAEDFLDSALEVSKKGTIIHFYNFRGIDDFKGANDAIKVACKRNKKNCSILRTVKCGQHAPNTYRICVDFKII